MSKSVFVEGQEVVTKEDLNGLEESIGRRIASSAEAICRYVEDTRNNLRKEIEESIESSEKRILDAIKSNK